MSAIASFTLLQIADLAALRKAAVPRKRWFGGETDGFSAFLKKHGREVYDYTWSGYVIAVVFPFLSKRQILLGKSEYDGLLSYLGEKRGGSWLALTADHKRSCLSKTMPGLYSDEDVREFYNAFNGTKEDQVGQSMLDGISAVHASLAAVDDDHIVLIGIR